MKITKILLEKMIREELESFSSLPVRKAIEQIRYMDPDEVTNFRKLTFSEHPSEVVRDYAAQKFGEYEDKKLVHEDEDFKVYTKITGKNLRPGGDATQTLLIFVSKRNLGPKEGFQLHYGTQTFSGLGPEGSTISIAPPNPPEADEFPRQFDEYMHDYKMWFYLNNYIAEGPLAFNPMIPDWIKGEARETYDYQEWQWDVENWLNNNEI